MRKYALLMLIVLGIGAPAWSATRARVIIPDCVSCWDCVKVTVRACVPAECEVACVKKSILGNIILVDIYLKCECQCGCGCPYPRTTQICEKVYLGKFCPGIYSVIANVYCRNVDKCCPQCKSLLGSPTLPCAAGAGFFRVRGCTWPWWL